VLAPIRSLLGLGEAEAWQRGGAAAAGCERVLRRLGMAILDVYGMTETTGAFTANTPDAYKLGRSAGCFAHGGQDRRRR